jgi:hypothetical protein
MDAGWKGESHDRRDGVIPGSVCWPALVDKKTARSPPTGWQRAEVASWRRALSVIRDRDGIYSTAFDSRRIL